MTGAPNDEHGSFDDALISGYLDGELTQGDQQRVRLHLETCAQCSGLLSELRLMKETTSMTDFAVPDTQWDETPKTAESRLATWTGRLLGIGWLTWLVGYVIWMARTGGRPTMFDVIASLVFLVAVGLYVLPALLDRLETRKTDRYRNVKK